MPKELLNAKTKSEKHASHGVGITMIAFSAAPAVAKLKIGKAKSTSFQDGIAVWHGCGSRLYPCVGTAK